MNPHAQLAIQALENMRGDDLARARLMFRGMDAEKMKQQYFQSGKSCAQILAEYEAHDAKINDAIAWVKNRS